MIFEYLLQTKKKKCYGMQKKKQKQSRWDKTKTKSSKKKEARKHLWTKLKLIIWSWCCVCIIVSFKLVNNNMILWVTAWQNVLDSMICLYCLQACICVCMGVYVLLRVSTSTLTRPHTCCGIQPWLAPPIAHLTINVQYCSSLIKN